MREVKVSLDAEDYEMVKVVCAHRGEAISGYIRRLILADLSKNRHRAPDRGQLEVIYQFVTKRLAEDAGNESHEGTGGASD